jgi:carbamoyl-phosphate synthase large subunit
METGLTGFDDIILPNAENDPLVMREALGKPTHDRMLLIAQAFRHGMSVADIHGICKVDPWFLDQIKGVVDEEKRIIERGLFGSDAGTPLPLGGSGDGRAVASSALCMAERLMHLKRMGFSDARLAKLTGQTPKDIAALRDKLNVRPVFKRIDTCAAEFASNTAYMYSTYEGLGAECEAHVTDKKKIIILGGGPNRIGQGIEFDYCCVHAVFALREAGYETIMVNCNPETVSTDYDTANRLYFEPLVSEDVIAIVRTEQSKGTLLGVIVQFGGQTPLKLADELQAAGIPILGTSPDAIDMTEDRERFQQLLKRLKLRQPENGVARSGAEAEKEAERIGYPVVLRPSYVLGGRAMEIVRDVEHLRRYVTQAVKVSGNNPVLIDRYLSEATEVDVDVICDGQDVYIAGVMEHIEEAGIHSGDSACSLPPHSLPKNIIEEIEKQSKQMALDIGVVGLMNVQFAVKDGTVYILEVNPRASRTVPFVAKNELHGGEGSRIPL